MSLISAARDFRGGKGVSGAADTVDPVDVLRFLMEQRDLLQKDRDVFGTPSVVSEVMSGKRGLNQEHIRRLAAVPRVAWTFFLTRLVQNNHTYRRA